MIVLFLVTRDQAELLGQNIEHHLDWGFDHVAVVDHESTDDTPKILASFGDAVSSLKISDWFDRGSAFAVLLERVEGNFGLVEWGAVSDTDEFWWDEELDLPTILVGVPDEKQAAQFPQKLFLPTELDPPNGPVFVRQTYRSGSFESPLHKGYRKGKTLYRGAWLRANEVTGPHWSRELPHPRWVYERSLVHHYMVLDEDDLVRKAQTLEQIHPPAKPRDRIRKLIRRTPASGLKMGLL